jgi:hypothetical protein
MIKIEVTGDNAEQVFAQLRGLVGQRGVVSGDAVIEVRGAAAEEAAEPAAEKPKRTRKPTEKADEGNAAADAAGTGTPTETRADAPPVEETPTEATPASNELNYEVDVAPKVLAAVQKAGKPAVVEVLGQFGVERASQLEAARWPELVEMLGDL